MGLMSRPYEENIKKDNERVIKVMETIRVPVQTAAKKFYHDSPQEFLHWLTMSGILVLVVLATLIRSLPWSFYLLIAVFVACQAVFNHKYGIIKKTIKRKNKKP